MDYYEQYDELFAAYQGLELGMEKLSRAEELVALADRHLGVELMFHSRLTLVRAATFVGENEKALVGFAWLLGTYDGDPDRYSFYARSLMWRYKWMVGKLASYPTFSKDEIEGRFADIEARFARAGFNLRAVWQQRGWTAMSMNNPDGLALALSQWKYFERDALADCAACEANFEMKARFHLGDIVEGLRLGQPLVDGTLSCENVPHGSFGPMALQLYERDPDGARELHRRGWGLIEDRVFNFEDTWLDHLTFSLRDSEIDEAIRLVSDYWSKMTTRNPADRVFVIAGALRVAPHLDGPLPIRGGQSIRSLNGGALTAAAVEGLRAELVEIVDALDARNGNDGWRREFGDVLSG